MNFEEMSDKKFFTNLIDAAEYSQEEYCRLKPKKKG